MRDLSVAKALAQREHLIALDQTVIHLWDKDDQANPPWDKATGIDKGGGRRLNGPTGFYVVAEIDGLTFKWNVDFEGRDANGRSVSMFDSDRLREVMLKLPLKVRKELALFLQDEVLPGLEKTTAEWREYLRKQWDSEDCVRGLIAFATFIPEN